MQKVILFQGDSITDCSRDRQNHFHKGRGYATMVSGILNVEFPYQYTIYNRGITGNSSNDLYARRQEDIFDLKPDYMSLLIGVNDVWGEIVYGKGIPAETYEKTICSLIDELKEKFPNIKIMLLEPFVLPGLATENTEEFPDRWERFYGLVCRHAETAKRIAEKYNLVFVPLQDMFTKVNEGAPAGYWCRDGVHPTDAGHELIKREWLKAFEKMK